MAFLAYVLKLAHTVICLPATPVHQDISATQTAVKQSLSIVKQWSTQAAVIDCQTRSNCVNHLEITRLKMYYFATNSTLPT